MDRRIVGYHRDDELHWVAELECGHNQHVRHNPPWTTRPWVVTPQGRTRMLGTSLRCKKCDEGEPRDWHTPASHDARDVRIAHAADQALIEQLLDDYLEELLGWRPDYPDLSLYWSQAHRRPFLILARDQTAGFALVREVDNPAAYELAEFYVVRGQRRQGVGRQAAIMLFEMFQGRWQLQFAVANAKARTFWHSVVPHATETSNANGLVHTITWTTSSA